MVILCSEDRLADLLGHWLAPTSLELRLAAHGREAAEIVAQTEGDLVLVTDRTVPPWPGLPPLPVLKQQHPGLRVVVIGRIAGNAGQVVGLSASGADVTLTRPLTRQAVMRSIVETD